MSVPDPFEGFRKPVTPPDNADIKIWRYTNFAKFVDFIDRGALYFSAAAYFEDPYEGAVPKANRLAEEEDLRKLLPNPDEFIAQTKRIKEGQRYWTFINCWHMNEHEQAGMWKEYASHDAIAITSTYARLRACLPTGAKAREQKQHDVSIGTVNYLDYDNERMPDDMSFILWPYVHKRKSFAHEHELRAIILDYPPPNPETKIVDLGRRDGPRGLHVPIDLRALLDTVYVAPTCASWFGDLVSHILAKYGLEGIKVEKSRMHERPLY